MTEKKIEAFRDGRDAKSLPEEKARAKYLSEVKKSGKPKKKESK